MLKRIRLTTPARRWGAKQVAKRERTGPSAEAVHEQRNAQKLLDPTVVGKNAGKMFPG
jgi:hypothetical protein